MQHTPPHCNTLQHTATHCNTLLHTAIHCNTIRSCSWVPRSMPESFSMFSKVSALVLPCTKFSSKLTFQNFYKCTTRWCSWVPRLMPGNSLRWIVFFSLPSQQWAVYLFWKVLLGVCWLLKSRSENPKSTTTHCNILQHTAAHYNTLQHTASHYNTLQRTATHCITLQHTATHCNTLQYWECADSPKRNSASFRVSSQTHKSPKLGFEGISRTTPGREHAPRNINPQNSHKRDYILQKKHMISMAL